MARMVHQIFASGKRPDSCGFQLDAKLVSFASGTAKVVENEHSQNRMIEVR